MHVSKVGHIIEIFSAGCSLCVDTINVVEFGKCASCKLIVYDMNNMSASLKEKIEKYKIRVVPTIVIDGQIKVEGIPDFPWFCGDEFYNMLREKFPIS